MAIGSHLSSRNWENHDRAVKKRIDNIASGARRQARSIFITIFLNLCIHWPRVTRGPPWLSIEHSDPVMAYLTGIWETWHIRDENDFGFTRDILHYGIVILCWIKRIIHTGLNVLDYAPCSNMQEAEDHII